MQDCRYFNWRKKTKQCQLLSNYKDFAANEFLDSGYCSTTPPTPPNIQTVCVLEEQRKYNFDVEKHLIGGEVTNSSELCLESCKARVE